MGRGVLAVHQIAEIITKINKTGKKNSSLRSGTTSLKPVVTEDKMRDGRELK